MNQGLESLNLHPPPQEIEKQFDYRRDPKSQEVKKEACA